MRLLFIYEAIALAAVFVSFFAEDKNMRAAAVMVAASRLIGDLAWIYLPIAPAQLVHNLGFIDFTHNDTRALVDGTFASVIAVLYLNKSWGRVIWTGFIAMLFAHALRELSDLGYIGYAYAINGLFLAMASVFFCLGGGEAYRYVRDFVSHYTHRYRDRHSSHHTTLTED